jgi:hypothetical protein
MLQYSASPREGHLEAVYHIFAYLATHTSGCIVFDATTPLLDEDCFQHDVDWRPFTGTYMKKNQLICLSHLGYQWRYHALWMQIMLVIWSQGGRIQD